MKKVILKVHEGKYEKMTKNVKNGKNNSFLIFTSFFRTSVNSKLEVR